MQKAGFLIYIAMLKKFVQHKNDKKKNNILNSLYQQTHLRLFRGNFTISRNFCLLVPTDAHGVIRKFAENSHHFFFFFFPCLVKLIIPLPTTIFPQRSGHSLGFSCNCNILKRWKRNSHLSIVFFHAFVAMKSYD